MMASKPSRCAQTRRGRRLLRQACAWPHELVVSILQVIRVDEATGGHMRIGVMGPWAAATPHERYRVLAGERVAMSGDFALARTRGRRAQHGE